MFAATITSVLTILLTVICVAAGVDHQSAATPLKVPNSTHRQVVVQDSERHELASDYVDDTIKIHVYLPRGYDKMKDPMPAVYLLDAEYSFGAVAYIIRRLVKDKWPF